MPFDETQTAALQGPAVSGAPTRPATRRQIRTLGGTLIILAVLVSYLFLVILNAGISGVATAPPKQICAAGNFLCFHVTTGGHLLILVMLAGALGSLIHATTSFGDFVGNRQLTANWLWWYILKPIIGTILATVVYLCVKAGFLSAPVGAENANVAGILALSGLVGMFSKQATDKLGEVFDTLFRTKPGGGDLKRSEGHANPLPVLGGIDPARLPAGSHDAVLALSGRDFVEGSVAHVNGSARPTSFRGNDRLSATLLDTDMLQAGLLNVTVVNPPPGGGTSEPQVVTIFGGDSGGTGGAFAPAMAVATDREQGDDGCEVAITNATADEDLPAARGGVAS